MTQKLFLAWRDPETGSWYPVGRLQNLGDRYEFVYTRGALRAQRAAGFCPFPGFPDIGSAYESEELFPLFANRLLARGRAEYADFIEWMSVSESEADPVVLLARSGGQRATDTLEVFPCPERSDS